MRSRILLLALSFTTALAHPRLARAEGPEPIAAAAPWNSVFFYAGIATNAPLLDIIKLSIPRFENYASASLAWSHRFWRSDRYLALDGEIQFTRYLETPSLFSVGAASMLRLVEPPWHATLPGSFGFGAGWSWASAIPGVETASIPKSSRGLLELQMEFEFEMPWGKLDGRPLWSAFLRDQHRSGIFGLIDGVVGGSDYFCLGLRRRF